MNHPGPNREGMTTLLTKWGYEVVTACDGTEAAGVLEQDDAPRLAVLDWMMPGTDGIEICRSVRAAGSDAYVYLILVTAQGRQEHIIQGLDAGADDYVTKPFQLFGPR